jgi:hypothetical protein
MLAPGAERSAQIVVRLLRMKYQMAMAATIRSRMSHQ